MASTEKKYPSWQKHRVSVPIDKEEYDALDRAERFLQKQTGHRGHIPYTKLLRVMVRRAPLDDETVKVFRELDD